MAEPLTHIERQLLELVAHDRPPSRVRRPTPGQDNTIAVVDERWVIRVARTDDARSYHANEVAVLSALGPGCRVPRLRGARHHGIVYDYVSGTRLSADAWNGASPKLRASIGSDIREVLHSLHDLSADALPDPAEVLDRRWVLESIERCSTVAPRAPLDFDPAALASRFEAAWSLAAEPTTLLHVDLKPDNLITDGRRAWVIDFGGICLGDPAIDHGVLAHHFGERMLDLTSGDDAALAARARCFADLYHLRRCTRGWTRSAPASLRNAR